MKNKEGIIHFLLLILMGGIGLLLLLKYYLFNQTNSQSPLLINHIANFEKLTIHDLPDVGDNPKVYDYNDNRILVGNGKIVEYDFENESYIRMSDRNVLDCGYGTQKIGDYLYSSCNLSQKFPLNSSFSYGQVFKIDLKSGKLVKRYFKDYENVEGEMTQSQLIAAHEKREGRLINPYLASKDNFLWISSWDGVIKMDINTEKMESYENEKIFGNGCFPDGIFNDNGKITVTSALGSFCSGVVSVLDESINSWNREYFNVDFSKPDNKYETYLKEKGFFKLSKPEINIPNFYYLTPLYNETYYLVASDGIYTLKKDQMPIKLFGQKIQRPDGGFFAKETFSNDSKYFVYIVPTQTGGGHSMIEYGLSGYLIDFEKSSFVNLILENKPNQQVLEKLNDTLKDGKFKEENNKIKLVDPLTEKVLITINLATNKIRIEQ